MDPYIQQNRSFDTDLLILRSLFALDPNTQLPISTGYILSTDGVGGLTWVNPILFGGISLPMLTSTVTGLGTLAYVSTSFLDNALTSTTQGLGLLNYVSSSQLASTVQGLGTVGYVSTQGLNSLLGSTVRGLGTAGYVSTATLGSTLQSTTAFIFNPVRYISSGNLISTTSGILNNTGFYATFDSLYSTTAGLGTIGYLSASTLLVSLPSTVAGLGQAGYVSTTGLRTALLSTVTGLGTASYVSSLTPALPSTVEGLGTVDYVSVSKMVQYVTDALANIGTNGNYVSAPTLNAALVSTNEGLATFGYISTASLASTLQSTTAFLFDPVRYISAGNLVSTTQGVLAAQTSAVNNAALQSTVAGLGNSGYVSSLSLRSTITGLGSASYISTLSLQSTVTKLLDVASSNTFINIDRAGNLTITGGNVYVSTLVGNVIYLSTFMFSSVTYRGTNGNIDGVVLPNPISGRDLIFSTCVVPFDTMSSYMNTRSRIYVDIYPTFAFNELNTGATGSMVLPLSTVLYRGTTLVPNVTNTSYLVANSKTAGFSNYFQASVKLQIPGSEVAGQFANEFRLYHYMPNALTLGLDPGLKSNAVTIQYSSTNGIFLSLQNLP